MRLRPWSVGLAVCLAIGSAPWLLPCAGQPAPDTTRRTVTEGLPGVTIFSPQRWGIVGVTIANPSDTPAEVISAHSFSADPALQFARQVWIPPRAKRSSWYPVLPPQSSARGANLEVKSVLIDRSGTREILLRDTAGGGLINEGLLPSQQGNEPVTGLIADPEDPLAWVLAQAALAALDRSPRLVRLDAGALAP